MYQYPVHSQGRSLGFFHSLTGEKHCRRDCISSLLSFSNVTSARCTCQSRRVIVHERSCLCQRLHGTVVFTKIKFKTQFLISLILRFPNYYPTYWNTITPYHLQDMSKLFYSLSVSYSSQTHIIELLLATYAPDLFRLSTNI